MIHWESSPTTASSRHSTAQYNPAYLVALGGTGGYLELHMSEPISTAGFTLGVHTAVGLDDTTGGGDNSNPAATYTNPRSATVLVSANGVQWVSLGDQQFDIPTNYYTDVSGPYTNTPGSEVANFGQPFTGTLDSFDGESFSGTIAVLNGSAGGTWLNLSGTGLAEVNYVAFQTSSDETMFVNAVVGVPVPEPVGLMLLGGAAFLLKRSRKTA